MACCSVPWGLWLQLSSTHADIARFSTFVILLYDIFMQYLFSVEQIPKAMQWIIEVLPLTHTSRLLRQLAGRVYFMDQHFNINFYTVLFMLIAFLKYKKAKTCRGEVCMWETCLSILGYCRSRCYEKKSLLLNIINPQIGGVLICGQKGTAKSTVVRSLANLSNCNVVNVPLSVTEDRLVGSIDLSKRLNKDAYNWNMVYCIRQMNKYYM